MNIDKQIIKDIRKEFNLDINDMILFLLVSQIKQSILKAIMEGKPKSKHPTITTEYPNLGELKIDLHCFDKEIGYNKALEEFESVIKEVLK